MAHTVQIRRIRPGLYGTFTRGASESPCARRLCRLSSNFFRSLRKMKRSSAITANSETSMIGNDHSMKSPNVRPPFVPM